MKACRVRVGDQAVDLALTDFNRLRWTLAALRSNPALRQHIQGHRQPFITDSTHLIETGSEPVATRHLYVILWDGLNSLTELLTRRPAIAAHRHITYLPIGVFQEIAQDYPIGSLPLMPPSMQMPATSAHRLRGAWRADLRSVAQSALRPLKNRRQAPGMHRALTNGGQLVFCGLVSPTRSVFENFLLGVPAAPLRQSLSGLIDLDWRQPGLATQTVLQTSWEAIRQHAASNAAEWSALYAWCGVMHRMAVLSLLHAQTDCLVVNAFGQQAHFDPYDAWGYRHNHFIDFGSSRGPDLVYPRALDLHRQGKPSTALRIVPPNGSLSATLAGMPFERLWSTCEAQTKQLIETVQTLPT